MKAMKNRLNRPISLRRSFLACLRDERGVAMTEYLLIVGVILPVAFYLFNPNNGLYQGARRQYETTSLMLTLPMDQLPY